MDTRLDERDERLGRAACALDGLSVGDAFGRCFFSIQPDSVPDIVASRTLPPPPWRYTDDTLMALSIISILRQYERVDQGRLALSFAERYDPGRGYGPSMNQGLRRIRAGEPWRAVVQGQFEGQGSFGNGAAMRVAPLGAYFADDMKMVVEQARLSAEVTHTHPEGVAGAVAIAIAAAWAWRLRHIRPVPTRHEFLDRILPHVPGGAVASGIREARALAPDTPVAVAVDALGNGSAVSAQDTVPFVLWCAARNLSSYEDALWLTASGLGDVDTTCAMVGGIVALYTGRAGIPPSWMAAREPLPDWPYSEHGPA